MAVARGRLGLLGLELDVAHVDDVALGQRGQLLVALALEAIRVGLAEAGLHQHITAGGKRLAADIDGQLGVLVVLNGTGGCCLRLRLATAVTVPVVSPSTCAYAASAAALSGKRAGVWAILNSWSEASPSPRICQ